MEPTANRLARPRVEKGAANIVGVKLCNDFLEQNVDIAKLLAEKMPSRNIN